jgi:hypothetical protein
MSSIFLASPCCILGRLPGKAVNTEREHQRDRTKLSSLHGSGNVSTTIIEQILIKYLCCTEVGTKGMEP